MHRDCTDSAGLSLRTYTHALISCAAADCAAVRAAPAVHLGMQRNERETLVPAAYPALESEAYRSLDDADCDRATLIPCAAEQEELAAESRR